MICSQISKLLGIVCHPLNEDGSVAMLETPFVFEDGAHLPIFLEKSGPQIRFFDDGRTIMHFYGRGVAIDEGRRTRFIKSAAESNGVALNDKGILEIWAAERDASLAFAKYMSTMTQLAGWEKDQIGQSTDASILIAEVAQCLKAWKPTATIKEGPEYLGISGQYYRLDFDVDGQAVIAITPHHVAVSAAIKKLLDIKSRPDHSDLKVMAVIDDRYDSKAAKREGLIMDALATVWPMTKLEEKAGLKGRQH
jgi:hypothetical protein